MPVKKTESAVAKRIRKINVSVEETKEDKELQLTELTNKCYLAKEAADKATKDYEKARKELFNNMVRNDVKYFKSELKREDNQVTKLTASLGVRTTKEIDVQKLKNIVEDEEQLWPLLSISNEVAKKKFGDVIFAKCSFEKIGTTNVTVAQDK